MPADYHNLPGGVRTIWPGYSDEGGFPPNPPTTFFPAGPDPPPVMGGRYAGNPPFMQAPAGRSLFLDREEKLLPRRHLPAKARVSAVHTCMILRFGEGGPEPTPPAGIFPGDRTPPPH